MIDVRLVRDDPDAVKTALARKGVDPAEVDAIAALDRELRELASARDSMRARVKALSQDVRAARQAGEDDKAAALADESRALGEEERTADSRAQEVQDALRDALLVLPNLPAPEAADGAGEEDNPIVRIVGLEGRTYADHQRVPHWDIGTELGIIDNERAVKISGSMFPMLRGAGAALSRGLCSWFLDQAADAYEEIRPPTFVLTETITATGQLPKFADDAYHIERDDLWAIPTAEVPLTSIGRNEILDEADLPMRFCAYSPCYRREAGSAGKDTRGLLRSHEFDKVELVAYTTAAQAPALHDEILDRAVALVVALDLPYRILEICTGDLGQPHARQFDLEVYLPGADSWQEVSSVSWYSDYQARRANVRYRPADGGGTRFVHTLNGSALAVPRLLAALLETNRQPDGSVEVPAVLHPYVRGMTRIAAR